MSLKLERGWTDAGIEIKTFPGGAEGTIIQVSTNKESFRISLADFLIMVEYVLENTNLLPDDLRRIFLQRVRSFQEIEGWNEGMSRLSLPNEPLPEYPT